MEIPTSVKPAVWGVICGGVATMILGFTWGGWMTTGTAGQIEAASVKAAIVEEFTPICLAKAAPQLEKLAEFKEVSSWKQKDFVTKTDWVDSVSESYRSDVANACASALKESMKAS